MLIKDLNGNHVIQKCLNKLAPEDNQVQSNPIIFSSPNPDCYSLSTTLSLLIVWRSLLIDMDAVFYNDALTMHLNPSASSL